MKQFLLFIFLSLFAMAQTQLSTSRNHSTCTGEDISLNQFQWENRIIVMFIQNSGGEIISESSAVKIRSRLSPPNEDYSIFLIGKDGFVKLKQVEFLAPEELFGMIDRMPMRQPEMRDRG